ncbi:MAG: chaperone NapD [Desulfobacteria bacterium]
MVISSAVVEIRNGSGETVLNGLARIENVSVFGIKDNQIVAVIEDRDIRGIHDTMKKIFGIESVVGVYPVYAGHQDEQEAG